MNTKNMIETIKAKFEMISIVLNQDLQIEDLKHSKYLRALIDATENTYVHLNDSLCESLTMCKECAQKRDILMQYLTMFDDIEHGAPITPEIAQQLSSYPEVVNSIIDRIDTVLNNIH